LHFTQKEAALLKSLPDKNVPADVTIISVLSTLGIALSLFYARLGFMPLDQSIVFDGGWRILCGQIPYRDFVTPTAIVPIVIQTFFFKLFGVTWFSYCLHSAILTGVFSSLVYWLLRYQGGARSVAAFYGLLSSLVMSPPMGLLLAEHHALLFVTIALLISIRLGFVTKRFDAFCSVFLIPFVIALAFLSKQNPTAYSVPVILITLYVCLCKNRRLSYLRTSFYLALGVIFVFMICVCLIYCFEIQWGRIYYHFWKLPSGLGEERVNEIATILLPVKYFKALRSGGVLTQMVIHLGFVSSIGVGMRVGMKNMQRHFIDSFETLGVSALLSVMAIVFQLTTNNRFYNAFPTLFLGLGGFHIWIISKTVSQRGKDITRWVNTVIVMIAICDAGYLANYVCYRKVGNDIWFDMALVQKPKTSELSYMLYQVPGHYKISATDLDSIIEFFRSRNGNFLLFGDYSILYGLTNRPSVNPALWFHQGLTFSDFGTREFSEFEGRMVKNMEKYSVRYIVVEGNKTFMGVGMEDFPMISRLVEKNSHRSYVYGGFRIIEIGDSTIIKKLGQMIEEPVPLQSLG
jgi:hypothetical protein